MAQVTFIQVDENNLIVGVHTDEPNADLIPSNHSIVEATVSDPSGLLGLPDSDILVKPENRTKIGEPTDKQNQRAVLKNMSNELDLMTRLGEDTTVKQAEFDGLKATYNALP